MRAFVAFVVTLVAACAAPRTEQLARPRADGPTPAEQARANELYRVLQVRISNAHLDPRQPPARTPARVTEALPPAPSVLPIVRPRTRGDGVALADLALDRGDPLDAAAQYRALLADGDRTIAGYVNVRLAEAYRQLGQMDRADAALVAATRFPDVAWNALVQLALFRARFLSPRTVVTQLAPLVPARADDLENLLIHTSDRLDAGALLMMKVQRDPRAAHACEYAIAAVARGQHQIPPSLDGACQIEVERAVAIADGTLWLDERNPCRRQLAALRKMWEVFSTAGDATELWVMVAEGYVQAMDLAMTEEDLALASRSAVTVLFNVARLALRGEPVTTETRRRFAAVAAKLDLADREVLARVMAKYDDVPALQALWLPTQPEAR